MFGKSEEIIKRIESLEKKVDGIGAGMAAILICEVLKRVGLDDVLDEVASKVVEQLADSLNPTSAKQVVDRLSETLKSALRDEGTV